TQHTQIVDSITIQRWQADSQFNDVAEGVIEAFACELPQAYLAQMLAQTIWINLEYLSAEAWIETSHLLPSPNPQYALVKHFYFPGFNQFTGGLLREHDLIARRNAFQQSKSAERFLQKLAVCNDGSMKISLFCYTHSPLPALFHMLSSSTKRTTLLVPWSDFLHEYASFFGKKSLDVGDKVSAGQLTLQVLPFLSQDDYDQLLWACDINFVRGEDSWIRAVWAGKPFIWQPYLQSEHTHIEKLKAFLDQYYGYCQPAIREIVTKAHLTWLTDGITPSIWQHYLNNVQTIEIATEFQSNRLAEQPNLASKLVDFCNNL
ncbi:MAG: elongation factor P maturation arginine rhamnosyltransferase EarP, partial [Methylophilaceae bacterium]